MTLEEARQLKPGDRILVEMEVRNRPNGDAPLDEETGAVATFSKWIKRLGMRTSIHCSSIREKIAPPRRKFKAGDVVYAFYGYWGVSHDENENGFVEIGNSNQIRSAFPSELILICAAEDRADRKEGV